MRVFSALASIVSLAGLVQAQVEGWEPGPVTPGVAAIPAAWTSVNVSPGGPGVNPNWQVRNDGAVFAAFSGATYAFANFQSSTGANSISNYLMSPVVTLDNGTAISFYTRTVDFPAFPDRLELVYNTTGSTNPLDFTNVLVTVNPALTVTGYPTAWTQFTGTITGLAGPVSGRYAFHYNPTNGGPAGANSDYIGLDEVTFVPAGSALASNTTLGAGCVSVPDVSFYENFASSAAFDLSNSSISLLWSPTGYLAIGGLATYLPPSPTAQTLALTDDSNATVTLSQAMPVGRSATTSSLVVHSNGFISAAPGNADSFAPDVVEFLDSPATRWDLSWHDYNPTIAGSGQVRFEQIGNIAYVTWDGVWDFGGTTAANANTMQAQFDVTTGQVNFVYQTMSTLGNPRLVGFSELGASADPGSTDISTALPTTFSTTFAVLPLSLSASTRPVLGTNWNLAVGNSRILDLIILGALDTNIPDLSLLGIAMPGCGLRASLDFISVGSTFAFSVPNVLSLNGVSVFANGASLSPETPFGFVTSNGVQGTLGNL